MEETTNQIKQGECLAGGECDHKFCDKVLGHTTKRPWAERFDEKFLACFVHADPTIGRYRTTDVWAAGVKPSDLKAFITEVEQDAVERTKAETLKRLEELEINPERQDLEGIAEIYRTFWRGTILPKLRLMLSPTKHND